MFKCWSYNPNRNSYTGTFDTAQNLPSGLYTLEQNNYGEPVAGRRELRPENNIRFRTGPLSRVMFEVDTFWKSADHYNRLGVAHKRGFLFHGPAGCGKTGIISAIIQDTIERNGIAFQIGNGDTLDYFPGSLPLLKQIEKDRPVVAIIEDIDTLIQYDEEVLLEIMDGASSVGNGILFVATTNKLNKIPKRIRCRPSRIDTLIHVDYPSWDQRREYLASLVPESKAQILAHQTDGFSLAMLKELVLALEVYKKPLSEALETLRELDRNEEEN